jgi:hypothetical protein
MRFGIFYEHQLPRPWAPGDEHRLLTDTLEQVELPDRLGIDYLWTWNTICSSGSSFPLHSGGVGVLAFNRRRILRP